GEQHTAADGGAGGRIRTHDRTLRPARPGELRRRAGVVDNQAAGQGARGVHPLGDPTEHRSGQLEAAAFAGAEEDADFSDLAAGLVSDLLSLELEPELDSDFAAALLDVSVERESVR